MSSKMFKTRKSHLKEGWLLLQTDVPKLIKQIEEGGVDNSSLTTRDYMSCYTTVYNLSTYSGHDFKPLYDYYKKVFEEYINSTVLPSLREKKDELLLRELLKRWSNYKIITKWLSRVFCYVERYYITRRGHPTLEETAFLSFYDLVYDKLNKQVIDAILAMFDQERAGKHIDRTLVNDILAVYSEIEISTGKNNAKGFAERMIKENATLYFDEASNGIASLSLTDNTPKDMIQEKLNSGETSNQQSHDSVAWEGDVYSQVLGTDKSGDVCGLGLGPTPSLLWGNKSSLGNIDADMLEREINELKEKHVEEMNLMKQNQAKLLSEVSFLRQVVEKLIPHGSFVPQNFNGSSFGHVPDARQP